MAAFFKHFLEIGLNSPLKKCNRHHQNNNILDTYKHVQIQRERQKEGITTL